MDKLAPFIHEYLKAMLLCQVEFRFFVPDGKQPYSPESIETMKDPECGWKKQREGEGKWKL